MSSAEGVEGAVTVESADFINFAVPAGIAFLREAPGRLMQLK
jgi:hypothetical protein